MTEQEYMADLQKKAIETAKLTGEAHGMMRGLLFSENLSDDEKEVLQKWVDKTDKYFEDKIKETK